jgi:hypothetical protein
MKNFLFIGMVVSSIAVGCASGDSPVDPSQEPALASEEGADQTEDELKTVSYAQTGPIITKNCGGCHASYTTLAGIKAKRTAMIGKLLAGQMPKGNLNFRNTAAGKKVLKWLQTGKDL